MNKATIRNAVLAFAVGGSLVLAGCSNPFAGEPTPVATPLPVVEAPEQVVADATIVPNQHAELNFETSSIVAEVLVSEGEVVAQNAPIARLDTRDLELQVERAQVELERAQADYDRLVAGATEEEIAAARAEVERAQAEVQRVQGGVTGEDVAAARSRLEEARAALAELEAGPETTQVEQAQAALDEARINLQETRNRLSTAKTEANLRIEQAANDLRDAQAEYSRIYWENRERQDQLRRFGSELDQEARDREEAALRAVQDAETSVEQARLNYEQTQQAEITGIQAAETRVRDAQARLDELLDGADSDELAAARARVAQAQADLARLVGDERAGQVAAAQASVANAQANLERVAADPRTVDLAVAEAEIRASEVALREAQLALEKATLFAPFAGTVAEMNLKVGELPPPNEPAVLLADFSTWQIETDDLTELSVVKIRENDPALVTFDALPGFELPGTVTQIKPVGENRQGDIVYTVVITPDEWDERLRWNMTATVAIMP